MLSRQLRLTLEIKITFIYRWRTYEFLKGI